MKSLGQRIRQAREQRGLSQEEFADLISRDQRAVSEYENGKRKITVTELPRFADALGMPLAYFYEESLEPDDLDNAMLHEFHQLPSDDAKQDAIDMMRLLSKMLRHPTT